MLWDTCLARSVRGREGALGYGDPWDARGWCRSPSKHGLCKVQMGEALLQSLVLALDEDAELLQMLTPPWAALPAAKCLIGAEILSPITQPSLIPAISIFPGLSAVFSQWINRNICEKSGHGCLIQQPWPFPIYLIFFYWHF